jgi:hypothetical protein
MEVNFKKDLHELLHLFPFAQTISEKNQAVIAVMNCLLNYIHIEDFLYKYPVFSNVVKMKCHELLQDSYASIEVRDLCMRVLDLF